jgi:hypothetical protein
MTIIQPMPPAGEHTKQLTASGTEATHFIIKGLHTTGGMEFG